MPQHSGQDLHLPFCLLFKWSLDCSRLSAAAVFLCVQLCSASLGFILCFPYLHQLQSLYTHSLHSGRLWFAGFAGFRQHIAFWVVSEIEVFTVSSSLSACHCILYKGFQPALAVQCLQLFSQHWLCTILHWLVMALPGVCLAAHKLIDE